MTVPEQLEILRAQIYPRMHDAGIEAFVLVAYLKDADDKIQRVCIAHSGNNPAYEDGLRPIIQVAGIWSGQIPPPSPQ
jgi:hypothetical protein